MDLSRHSDFHIDIDHWPSMRSRIEASTGGDYKRFKATLDARYAIVWRDIALGYAALVVIIAAAALADSLVARLIAIPFAAVAIGFTIAYLQLFIHEAAHWNLARDRAVSDRIADSMIAWQVGTSIAAYRRAHFAHHNHFGSAEDGERSYAFRLTPRFVFEMLTGIHAVRIFLTRANGTGEASAKPSKLPLLRGIAIHGAILLALIATGNWHVALAWIGGMAVIFPFFATIRPLIEHRPAADTPALTRGDRDATTRLFDDGVFARIFGGAGFNRHLLHHWEPSISYTRLPDLDRYLSATEIGPLLDARRTSYVRAFRDIMVSDRG